MCGVVSIIYGDSHEGLGREAGALLKKLEYRGYDSTGAAVLDAEGRITLRKKVGAPSRVIQELDIERLAGQRFVGQVRWATYGSVTDLNAQPHEVDCRVHLVGAHNGNISNTDSLKEFLADNSHRVLSDNDGEMLVHVVEHFYSEENATPAASPAQSIDRVVMAIRRANHKVIGSYAACFAIPNVPGVFAVKAGSSLYAGKGHDEAGDFIVVSSDLTSVLSKTRFLIPLAEGDGIYFTHDSYFVFSLEEGTRSVPKLRRSKLNVAEIALQKKYHFFMEQEIFSTSAGLDQILRYYFMKSGEDKLFAVFEQHKEDCKNLIFDLLKLYDIFDPRQLLARFRELVGNERFLALEREIPVMERLAPEVPRFSSDEGQLFHEIYEIEPDLLRTLHLLDEIVIWKKKRKVIRYKNRLLDLLKDRHEAGGRIFFVGSGTSYHASLLGGNFFNNISSCAIIPCNPGLFRSAYLGGLCERDMVVGVTQSGETKDLVDIYNDIRQVFSPEQVPMISIVNNENSTIPQEKSDFFLPILCGPEIAVAATKSFISQVAIFYVLANSLRADEAQVRSRLERVRDLIDLTLQTVEEEVSTVALRLYLKPSLHILGTSLIGLAQEGALKIREVVLNHAQGYDSAEFKHGPNTILGKNTIYSFRDLEHLLSDVAEGMQEAVQDCRGFPDGWEAMIEMLDRVRDFRFRGFPLPEGEGTSADRLYRKFRTKVNAEDYFSNYPLFFVCSPDERDRRITITQIHTHKIRGADVVLIAEDDEELRKAVEGRPAGLDKYYAKFIRIPGSSDRNVFVFQAALVLQLLALKMSVAKMKYLNSVHIENHGVHPDVPKNVSKSITVD